METIDGTNADLVQAVPEWRRRMSETKQRIAPPAGAWYAYDTLGSIGPISRLLDDRPLAELASGLPLLDIGAGDGDLAFLLESLGYVVHAIDYPPTNANSMTGIAQLKAALHSSVEIAPVDLEGPFELPAPRYGLGFCLGVLYHLKNPYHALEALARRIGHLILSTRVAQFGPDRTCDFRHLPVAYLVDARELNQDHTNYWIFSEAGLKRLLDRTGWELLNFFTGGCTSGSDPVHADADERAYCLLRSRHADPGWSMLLASGWHELEQNSWRWTARRFSVWAQLAGAAALRRIEFDFFVTGERFAAAGATRLSARLNGVSLGTCVAARPGDHTYAAPVPKELAPAESLHIEFELDKPYAPAQNDIRELGVIVRFVRLGSPQPRSPMRLIFA